MFPLVPGTKKPRTIKGHKAATTDVQTIRRWWQDCPQANVGIRTGDESGLLVVAPDLYKEGCVWPQWSKEFGRPDTHTVRSASGGEHFYFELPPGKDWRCSVNDDTKIDVRANGGYVVAPSSVFGGRPYELLRGGKISSLPDWLLDKLLKPQPPEPPLNPLSPPTLEYGLVVPERAVFMSLPTARQANHKSVFRLACRLRAAGVAHPAGLKHFNHWYAMAKAGGWLTEEYREYRYKFEYDWKHYDARKALGLRRRALERAKAQPLPPVCELIPHTRKAPIKKLLLSWCAEMERALGPGNWWLDVRTAASLLEVDPNSTRAWFKDFRRRDILKVVTAHTRALSPHYRFNVKVQHEVSSEYECSETAP